MSPKKLRSFGFIVGGIFALIGVWPAAVHHAPARWWAIAAALCFLLPALLFPGALYWPHKAWMAFGHVMGAVNTRILLGIVFYGVITPLGVFRSWLGKDSMGRRSRPELESYRVLRTARPPRHLKRQY
ncbi:MAG TPA: SxtJ family membrane protein [Candidatus Binatia bacterium]